MYESYLSTYEVIVTERAPWGHPWDGQQHDFIPLPFVGFGVHDVDDYNEVMTAIRGDRISTIERHGVEAAITSPMGSLQWYLSASPYWTLIDTIDGTRLWEFNTSSSSTQSIVSPVNVTNCMGCESKTNIWHEFNHYADAFGFSNSFQFIEEGTSASVHLSMQNQENICLTYITHGSIASSQVRFSDESVAQLNTDSGYHRLCHQGIFTSFTIQWSQTEPTLFLDPTGLSGRSEHIIGATGISLIATETS